MLPNEDGTIMKEIFFKSATARDVAERVSKMAGNRVVEYLERSNLNTEEELATLKDRLIHAFLHEVNVNIHVPWHSEIDGSLETLTKEATREGLIVKKKRERPKKLDKLAANTGAIPRTNERTDETADQGTSDDENNERHK